MQIELQKNSIRSTTVKPDTTGYQQQSPKLFGTTDTQNNRQSPKIQQGIEATILGGNIDPRVRAAYTPMRQIDFSSMSYEQQLEYKQWQIEAVIADRRRILRPPLPDFVKIKPEESTSIK